MNHDQQPETGLPKWPTGWYIVCRTVELQPNRTKTGQLAGKPFVLYRSADKTLHAIDAHCPHMGAHLVHGKVIGRSIRCPLHHWVIDDQGMASGAEKVCKHTNIWKVTEQYGLIFLFLGDTPPGPLPEPASSESLVWTTGQPVELATDWHSMIINGFDMLHLNSVHKRQLLEPARFTQLTNNRLELAYKSRITGRSPSDIAMKWLSGNCVRVRQTCHGTTIAIETDLGFTRSAAVLGILTIDNKVRLFGAFGIEKGLFSTVRLAITRWLFTAFLKRDFKILTGMNLNVNVEDEGVQTITRFLRSLAEEDT